MKILTFFQRVGRVVPILAVLGLSVGVQAAVCSNPNLDVIVLGSGGPELNDKRASVGYLVRENGRAAVLVDFGSGTSFHFEQSGAKIEDLQAILLSQFHVDHVNDFPALVKGAFFTDRERDLPVYGPSGNQVVPALPQYLERLLSSRGAYSYLSGFLDGSEAFRFKPVTVSADVSKAEVFSATLDGGFRISAVPVTHSIIPALGWRVEKDGCAIVFSSGTSNIGRTLDKITTGANLFIAHNAIPESSVDRIARKLHMMPSEIGRIAADSGVKSVVLSHFMNRTESVQHQTAHAIHKRYRGKLAFAQDCDVYSVQQGEKIASCVK